MNKKEVAGILVKDHNCTPKQAKIIVNFMEKIEKAVDKGITPTYLDKDGVLLIRNAAAELGTEVTPDEMGDMIELMNIALEREINSRDREGEEWKQT